MPGNSNGSLNLVTDDLKGFDLGLFFLVFRVSIGVEHAAGPFDDHQTTVSHQIGCSIVHLVAQGNGYLPEVFSIGAEDVPGFEDAVRLILPAVGWRYYQYRRESSSRRPYLVTVGTVFSVGGLTALFACAAFFRTQAPIVLTGVAGYLLLAGVLWPNEFRYEEFTNRDEDGVSS